MNKRQMKDLQKGHREAARRSAHPIWQVQRGDAGVSIKRTQPETTERQDQDEQVQVVGVIDPGKKYNRMKDRLDEQKDKVEELKKSAPPPAPAAPQPAPAQPGAPASPSGQGPHKCEACGKQDANVGPAHRTCCDSALFKPPYLCYGIDECAHQAKCPRCGKEPAWKRQDPASAEPAQSTASPAAGPRTNPWPRATPAPGTYDPFGGLNDPQNVGGSPPAAPQQEAGPKATKPRAGDPDWNEGYTPLPLQQLTPENSFQKGEEEAGYGTWLMDMLNPQSGEDTLPVQVPKAAQLRSWAQAAMPKPQDIDRIISSFMKKAENKTIKWDKAQLSQLRQDYLTWAQKIHQHRMKYIDHLIRQIDKQYSKTLREQAYNRFVEWVQRQRLNDAVQHAVFQALQFLRENSQRLVSPSPGQPPPPGTPKAGAVDKSAAFGLKPGEMQRIIGFLEMLQEQNLDISDPNKVMTHLGRHKNGQVLQAMLQKAITSVGSYPALLDMVEWARGIQEDDGTVGAPQSVPTPPAPVKPAPAPQQAPVQPAPAPQQAPAEDQPAESFGMTDLPSALSGVMQRYIDQLRDMTPEQLEGMQQVVNDLTSQSATEEEQAAAEELGQALESERVRRSGQEQWKHDSVVNFLRGNPANKMRVQMDGQDPYYLTLSGTEEQSTLVRKYLDGGAAPAQPGDQEKYDKIERDIAQKGLAPKPKPAPQTVPPVQSMPPKPSVEQALQKLRPPQSLAPKPAPQQVPSAPMTPAAPPEPEPETPSESMEDVGTDVQQMIEESDQMKPVPTPTPAPQAPAPAPQAPAPKPIQAPAAPPKPGTKPAPRTVKRPTQIEQEYGISLDEPTTIERDVLQPPDLKDAEGNEVYQYMADQGIWVTNDPYGEFLTVPGEPGPVKFGRVPNVKLQGRSFDIHITPSPRALGTTPVKAFIGQAVMNKQMFNDYVREWSQSPPPGMQFPDHDHMIDEIRAQCIGYIIGWAPPPPSPDASTRDSWLQVWFPNHKPPITMWLPVMYVEEDKNRGVLPGHTHPNFGQPGYPGHDKNSQQMPQMPQQPEPPGVQMAPTVSGVNTVNGQPPQPGDMVQPQQTGVSGPGPEADTGKIKEVMQDGTIVYDNDKGEARFLEPGKPVEVIKPTM